MIVKGTTAGSFGHHVYSGTTKKVSGRRTPAVASEVQIIAHHRVDSDSNFDDHVVMFRPQTSGNPQLLRIPPRLRPLRPPLRDLSGSSVAFLRRSRADPPVVSFSTFQVASALRYPILLPLLRVLR